VLAAYLDGATDEVTTARIERRLAADPALAARLDELATVRARLQRLSQVRAPDDVRQRLRARLTEERMSDAATDPARVESAPAGGEQADRRRRWMAGVAPRLAVAVVALVAIVALGAAAVQLLGGVGASGSGERAAVADSDGGGEAAQEDAGAAEGRDQAATSPDAMPSEAAAAADVPTVRRDQQVIARALRQERRTPRELRARERRLRRRAGLPTDQLCVTDLEGRTVDLVQRDGRLVLAVLVPPGDQIVLVDPRTCAPERTIPVVP
jgi:anti-sigma factor RsiW